jgi:Na+-translocating ferredoxin:NAD+ oxidoreductase RnfG subunit
MTRLVLSFVCWLGMVSGLVAKDDVYLKPSAFIGRTFPMAKPQAGALKLSASMQTEIKKIMGRAYSPRVVRYWTDGKTTAWILNEIGKTLPITTGYVVSDGKIRQVEVLIYRESHGWEVRQPFFTKQFKGAELKPGNKLTKRIDNIAGATLSVRAVTKMSKLALYLESQRQKS